MEPDYIKKSQKVDRWEQMLLQYFKKTQFSILKAFEVESYLLADVRSGKHIFSYMIRNILITQDAKLREVFA